MSWDRLVCQNRTVRGGKMNGYIIRVNKRGEVNGVKFDDWDRVGRAIVDLQRAKDKARKMSAENGAAYVERYGEVVAVYRSGICTAEAA